MADISANEYGEHGHSVIMTTPIKPVRLLYYLLILAKKSTNVWGLRIAEDMYADTPFTRIALRTVASGTMLVGSYVYQGSSWMFEIMMPC